MQQKTILRLINLLSVLWSVCITFKDTSKLENDEIAILNKNIKDVIKDAQKDKNIELVKKLNSLITSLNSYKKQKKTTLEYIEPVFRELLKTLTGEI